MLDQNLEDTVKAFLDTSLQPSQNIFCNVLKKASYDIKHACFLYLIELYLTKIDGTPAVGIPASYFTESKDPTRSIEIQWLYNFITELVNYFVEEKYLGRLITAHTFFRYYEVSEEVKERWL